MARYDPAAEEWRRLPDPDIAASMNSWILAGDRVVNPTTGTSDDGWPLGGLLDLDTGTWSELAPAGGSRSGRGPGASTGYPGAAGAWVVGGPRLYEPVTGTWHAIPLPRASAIGRDSVVARDPAAAWTGQELIVWGGAYYGNDADSANDAKLDTGLACTPPLPPP